MPGYESIGWTQTLFLEKAKISNFQKNFLTDLKNIKNETVGVV